MAAGEAADGADMNMPLIPIHTPERHHPETEIEHFQRLAQMHEFEQRMKRREERRARIRALLHRQAA
jgi:hypothetical protein